MELIGLRRTAVRVQRDARRECQQLRRSLSGGRGLMGPSQASCGHRYHRCGRHHLIDFRNVPGAHGIGKFSGMKHVYARE